MNKYRDLFEKYVVEVGRAPHALTRVWALGFCDWLARNESGLTQLAPDGAYICGKCGRMSRTTNCENCGHAYQRPAGKA